MKEPKLLTWNGEGPRFDLKIFHEIPGRPITYLTQDLNIHKPNKKEGE